MIFGIIIIIVGIFALLNNIGINIDSKFLWPFIIIVISLGLMIKDRKITFFNLLLMFIGAWYFLFAFNLVTTSLGNIFWPVVLILLGISIISSKFVWEEKISKLKKYRTNKEGRLEFDGVFGGITEKVNVEDFKGAIVNAIFGSVELNLTKIKIKEDVIIDVNSIFGGSTLIMPKEYNIVVNSFAIFGSNENKSEKEFDKDKKTIYVNCVSVFGGTEIK